MGTKFASKVVMNGFKWWQILSFDTTISQLSNTNIIEWKIVHNLHSGSKQADSQAWWRQLLMKVLPKLPTLMDCFSYGKSCRNIPHKIHITGNFMPGLSGKLSNRAEIPIQMLLSLEASSVPSLDFVPFPLNTFIPCLHLISNLQSSCILVQPFTSLKQPLICW